MSDPCTYDTKGFPIASGGPLFSCTGHHVLVEPFKQEAWVTSVCQEISNSDMHSALFRVDEMGVV